jgi:hypothetical protein
MKNQTINVSVQMAHTKTESTIGLLPLFLGCLWETALSVNLGIRIERHKSADNIGNCSMG